MGQHRDPWLAIAVGIAIATLLLFGAGFLLAYLTRPTLGP